MTSSPPTLTGFNNNVRYRGMRFHIQTEDSGITRPHITTHLFADGGFVIKSLRTDYTEYVDHPDRASLVQRMMRDQHRAVALELRDGKLDVSIDRIAPNAAAADTLGALASTSGTSTSGTMPLVTAADVAALVPPTQPPADAAEAVSGEQMAPATDAARSPDSEPTAAHGQGLAHGQAHANGQRPPGSGQVASSRRSGIKRHGANDGRTSLSCRPNAEKPVTSKTGSRDRRTPSSRKPSSSGRPPSSRGAGGASSKRAVSLTPGKPPSSRGPRRAGRPSVLSVQPGSTSLFGTVPQESLDDAILTYVARTRNGPPTRGSK
jgi:hypothetical protein